MAYLTYNNPYKFDDKHKFDVSQETAGDAVMQHLVENQTVMVF